MSVLGSSVTFYVVWPCLACPPHSFSHTKPSVWTDPYVNLGPPGDPSMKDLTTLFKLFNIRCWIFSVIMLFFCYDSGPLAR